MGELHISLSGAANESLDIVAVEVRLGAVHRVHRRQVKLSSTGDGYAYFTST